MHANFNGYTNENESLLLLIIHKTPPLPSPEKPNKKNVTLLFDIFLFRFRFLNVEMLVYNNTIPQRPYQHHNNIVHPIYYGKFKKKNKVQVIINY